MSMYRSVGMKANSQPFARRFVQNAARTGVNDNVWYNSSRCQPTIRQYRAIQMKQNVQPHEKYSNVRSAFSIKSSYAVIHSRPGQAMDNTMPNRSVVRGTVGDRTHLISGIHFRRGFRSQFPGVKTTVAAQDVRSFSSVEQDNPTEILTKMQQILEAQQKTLTKISEVQVIRSELHKMENRLHEKVSGDVSEAITVIFMFLFVQTVLLFFTALVTSL